MCLVRRCVIFCVTLTSTSIYYYKLKIILITGFSLHSSSIWGGKKSLFIDEGDRNGKSTVKCGKCWSKISIELISWISIKKIWMKKYSIVDSRYELWSLLQSVFFTGCVSFFIWITVGQSISNGMERNNTSPMLKLIRLLEAILSMNQ